jgi:hypothetical protein
MIPRFGLHGPTQCNNELTLISKIMVRMQEHNGSYTPQPSSGQRLVHSQRDTASINKPNFLAFGRGSLFWSSLLEYS